MLGYMQQPSNFMYADVLKRGKPVHTANDGFTSRHPSMDPGKRAKIFSPFDALKGFSDAVEAKEELYVERIELPEDECTVLDKIICRLRERLRSTDYIFGNTVTVAVTHFVPCADPYHDAYGSRGKYVKTTGTLTCIDTDVRKTMTVDGKTICFADIISIGIIK